MQRPPTPARACAVTRRRRPCTRGEGVARPPHLGHADHLLGDAEVALVVLPDLGDDEAGPRAPHPAARAQLQLRRHSGGRTRLGRNSARAQRRRHAPAADRHVTRPAHQSPASNGGRASQLHGAGGGAAAASLAGPRRVGVAVLVAVLRAPPQRLRGSPASAAQPSIFLMLLHFLVTSRFAEINKLATAIINHYCGHPRG